MSVHVTAGTHHTYRANGHDTVLSEIFDVHCILMPRALLVTGFSEAGEVVMASFNNYAPEDPAWDPGFFEHAFINEKLLGVPQQVKCLFIGSREELIVPAALSEDKAVRTWMESLQGICPDDVLYGYTLDTAGARYHFSLPARMDKLLHRFFGDTPILPVAAYHFHKPVASIPYLLQCLIADDAVIATLHGSGKLLWHQQFSYGTAEDIAWQIANLCRELHIPRIDLRLQCTVLCDECYDLGPELETFFPKITWSLNDSGSEGKWAPVVYLAQQLRACV